MAIDCDPDVPVATTTDFVLKNKKKFQNFLYGEIDAAGQLSFIVENLPKDGAGCPGWWMFGEMMRHFGPCITAIRGNWTYGDNLAIVNALTSGGTAKLEIAAMQGPTGKYAAAWGFTQVQVLPQTSGTPGSYSCVYVLFKK